MKQIYFLVYKAVSAIVYGIFFLMLGLYSADLKAQCANTLDYFTTASYSNQDGDLLWTSDWIETGDDGSPTGGTISINEATTFLNFRSSSTSVCKTISRSVDLTGYLNALFSYKYALSGSDASDVLNIMVSNDGGATFTTLQTLTGASGPIAEYSYIDITSYMSANTVIQFQVCGFDGVGEGITLDFVNVYACPIPISGGGCTNSGIAWESSTGVGAAWPANTQTTTYSLTGGVTATVTLIDPANRNGDNDLYSAATHPYDPSGGCLPYTGGGADNVTGNGSFTDPWDSDCNNLITRTNGAYGPNFFTYVINASDHTEETTLEFCFSQPVKLDNFTVSDIDYNGLLYTYNNFSQYESPGNSFQDEVTVTAVDILGNNVPLSMVAGSNITLSGQTATANYNSTVNGDLSPNDARGTITVSVFGAISCLYVTYSNGPDDAADEQANPNLYNWWSATHGPTNGASDNQAVRINGMTFCVCQPFDISLVGDTVCIGQEGTVYLESVSGGIPPYYYLWPDGSTGTSYSEIPLTTSLYPLVVITDIQGCSDTTSAPILVGIPTCIDGDPCTDDIYNSTTCDCDHPFNGNCCSILISATGTMAGPCDITGRYTLTVEISYGGLFSGEQIDINGTIFTLDGSGNEIFLIPGLTPTGALELVNVFSVSNPTCADFDGQTYLSPEPCSVPCPVPNCTNISIVPRN